MAQYKPNIDPFDGTNFSSWKFRMTLILKEKDVFEVIEHIFNETIYNTEAKVREYKTKDVKARSLIVQCVTDGQLELLKNKESAYDMWKCLEEAFEKKGIAGQMFLRKKLLTMRYEEGESFDDFISEFDKTIRLLKEAGAELRDEDAICNLLMSLPKSYETIIAVLEGTPGLTLDIVKNRLRAEEEKKKLNTGDNKKMKQQPTAFNSRIGTCYRCGEYGHFKKDCKKTLKGQERRGDTQDLSLYKPNTKGRGSFGNHGSSGNYNRGFGQKGNYRGRGNFRRGRNHAE